MDKKSAPIRILLVEDNLHYGLLLQEYLALQNSERFDVKRVESMREARSHFQGGGFDAVLLDLTLPDSRGMDTVEQATALAPTLPIIVLTGLNDEATATEAMRKGAQDFLIKGRTDSAMLIRAIRYAIERKRAEEAIRTLSLEDELTGLANRRGFFTLAEQQLKVARRTKTGLSLLFADVDGLKAANDKLGHAEGDRLIRDAAQALKATFRDSDVIARIGGDEFVVLMIETDGTEAAHFLTRLRAEVEKRNAEKRPSPLSLSVGLSHFEPEKASSLDELIRCADERMYEEKRKKRQG